MKLMKITKNNRVEFNIAIGIGAIPVIIFLLSRFETFLLAWKGLVCSSVVKIALGIAVYVALLLFRKAIFAFFSDDLIKNRVAVCCIYTFALIFAFVADGMVLRCCAAGNRIVLLMGAGILLGVFLHILLTGVCYLASKVKILALTKGDYWFLALLFIVINAAAIMFCTFMRQIFVWDNAGYFTKAVALNDIFPSFEYFSRVYNSIFETDYNYLIMLPASIMCKLFGESRLVFVLSIVNFYLFPLLVGVHAVSRCLFKNGIFKTIVAVLAVPSVFFLTHNGFIDIGGATVTFFAAAIYLFSHDERRAAPVGILLALSILLRRWYSFFALSFVIVAFIKALFTKKWKSFFIMLASVAFILLFFAQDFVSGKLLADYKDMYSAYALGIKTDILLFTRYYGWVFTAVMLIFAFIRKPDFNRAETFIGLQMVVCFFMFVNVQTHGQQHLMLYLPGFFILLLSLLSRIEKRSLIYILAAGCAFQTVNTFIPREQPNGISEIKYAAAVPNYSSYPKVDTTAEEILEITGYIDAEIGSKGKTVAFLSSSLRYNYDTLKNAEISLSAKQSIDIDRTSYLLGLSDVDKRDGLSANLFIADYLLVPSVAQTHLSPADQKVVTVPHEFITGEKGFGKAYVKEAKVFEMSDGVDIYLYRRTRDITYEEIEELKQLIFN